jgi:triosephosphate isomerase
MEIGGLKNVFVGAQTVSSYEEGSYTGEVTAKSLAGTVRFTIIGHSERRKTFGETDADLAAKWSRQKNTALNRFTASGTIGTPYPLESSSSHMNVAAIGTGQNESAEKVLEMKKKMKLPQDCIFIYGGSLNDKNVGEYLSTPEIHGFLIGRASLDPEALLKIAR